MGLTVLIAGAVVLLLLVALALIAIVMSDRAERRTVIVVVVTGGLLLLLLLLGCSGLAWYLTTQAPTPTPPHVRPAPTSAPPPPVPPASISLIPDSATVAQGESISVTIYITNATDLYGVEVHLTHGDGLSAGGLVPGTCAKDLIALSQTAGGRIDFAATRTSPHPPLSGDCDVAAFTLTGEAPGTYAIAFDRVILADRNGNALPVTPRGGSSTVVAPIPQSTIQPTVTPVASYPADVTPYAASLLPAEQDDVAALDDLPIYTLDVRVDWDALTVIGTETLLFTNNEEVSLDALYFRLYPNASHYEEGQTDIGVVTLDGQPAEFRINGNSGTVLEVLLPQPLAPEARVGLALPFTVTIPHCADRFGFQDDVMMLGHWYPMLAVYDDEGWNLDPYVEMGDAFYSDAGFYTVHLTVPDTTVVASTGVETQRTRLRTPETRFTFVSGATRDFALALSPRYRTLTRRVGDIQITSFHLPDDEEGGRMALDAAAKALQVFNDRFGPYPYTEFDVAETPFLIEGSPGGMEFPGLIFISTDFYDLEGLFAEDLDVIVAHETAHQWWYGVVGNNQVDEPWLDESFATFAQILYVEETEGEERARVEEMLWVEMPYLMVAMMDEDRPVATSLLEFDDSLTYSGIVYSKGALFLRELRELVGDETFFAILRHHYETYRYTIVPPDGFLRSVAEITDNDPDALALYDLWVLSDETPLDVEDSYAPGEEKLEELFRLLEELLGEMEDLGEP